MSEGEQIIAALRRQELVGEGAGWRAEVAPGGRNDRVSVVYSPDGAPVWTVRLPREGFGWRLRSEVVLLSQLAGSGLACAPRRPTIVSAPELPEGEALVHAWVPGEPAPLAEAGDRARETLGICLARLHANTRRAYTIWPEISSRSGTRRDAYAARLGTLRRYRGYDGGLGAELDGRISAALAEARQPLLPGEGWEGREFSLIHGDLSAGNILWSGDAVRLIDWEYVRFGDPAEDLAYLLSEQPIGADAWAQVVAGYLSGGGDPLTIARVARYRILTALDATLWWADELGATGGLAGRVARVGA